MTPTQAQIEAAAESIREALGHQSLDEATALARIALTAAAEVGMSDEGRWKIEKQIMLEQRRHTIERCELAIKTHTTMTDRAKHKAIAAIRALKDKP